VKKGFFLFPGWGADPGVMKRMQVDRGAIKFVMSGANIMCPGLTSEGGHGRLASLSTPPWSASGPALPLPLPSLYLSPLLPELGLRPRGQTPGLPYPSLPVLSLSGNHPL